MDILVGVRLDRPREKSEKIGTVSDGLAFTEDAANRFVVPRRT